jgi:hypothetical protein
MDYTKRTLFFSNPHDFYQALAALFPGEIIDDLSYLGSNFFYGLDQLRTRDFKTAGPILHLFEIGNVNTPRQIIILMSMIFSVHGSCLARNIPLPQNQRFVSRIKNLAG